MGATAKAVSGAWISGPNSGERGVVVDFRAGNLFVEGRGGRRTFGTPEHFQAEAGQAGNALMDLVLPAPTTLQLLRGAVRESLAHAWCTGQIGRVETRGWDGPFDYIVDNSEGSLALVRFLDSECVGVAFSDDPTRSYPYDDVLEAMPEVPGSVAKEMVSCPFFEHQGKALCTSIFWSSNGRIGGLEPWHVLYAYTGDILRRELLTAGDWASEALEDIELREDLASHIMTVSERVNLPVCKVGLDEPDIASIIPSSAPFRSEAIDDLLDDSLFFRRG